MERQKLIEILAAINLIVLLIILVFIVIAVSQPKQVSAANTYSINSYNTNVYPKQTITAKPYIVQDSRTRVYLVSDNLQNSKKIYEPLRYSSWSDFSTKRSVLGTDIQQYNVYVKNREYAGGYFTVKFYFEDYYGDVNNEIVTLYVRAQDKEKFTVKYVTKDKYKYKDWWYEVLPRSKTMQTQTRVYYN